MYRIFLFMALVPAFVSAATPFLSVGVAPSVTRFQYPTSDNLSPRYEENFIAMGGLATIGISSRVHEWYARFTWSNSDETVHQYENSVFIEDVASIYSTHRQADTWRSRRLAVGYRWQLVRSERKLMVGFAGLGLSAGRVKWRQSYTQTTETIYPSPRETERDTKHRESAPSSYYDFGGSVELGGRASLSKRLFIEASVLLGIDRPVFRETLGDIGLSNDKAGSVIEPAVHLALRWEIN